MSNMRSSDAMHPLAFAILSGMTPDIIDTFLVDERLEEISYDKDTDLVAISVESHTARRAYMIAKRFREKKIPVVMGGYHVTFMPDEALEYTDSVVVGESENLWNMLIKDFKNGSLKRVYKSSIRPSLNNLDFDRSIFRNKKYAKIIPVQFSRGCVYNCEFCSIHAFYGTSIRYRPIADIINEIGSINSSLFFFADDNILTDREKAIDLFNALIPLKISWACQVSIDVARDTELLYLMKKSGCIAMLIGFETLDPRNLSQMNKGLAQKYGDYNLLINRIREFGILIYGTFIFGYDFDTTDSFKLTLDFALKNKLFLANFNPLIPTPGTRLYLRFQKENRLIYPKWWLSDKYRYGESTFIPKRMTPDELTKGCYWARREFNKHSSIFKRFLDFKANCNNLVNIGVFLLTNYINRREVKRKQGSILGGHRKTAV